MTTDPEKKTKRRGFFEPQPGSRTASWDQRKKAEAETKRIEAESNKLAAAAVRAEELTETEKRLAETQKDRYGHLDTADADVATSIVDSHQATEEFVDDATREEMERNQEEATETRKRILDGEAWLNRDTESVGQAAQRIQLVESLPSGTLKESRGRPALGVLAAAVVVFVFEVALTMKGGVETLREEWPSIESPEPVVSVLLGLMTGTGVFVTMKAAVQLRNGHHARDIQRQLVEEAESRDIDPEQVAETVTVPAMGTTWAMAVMAAAIQIVLFAIRSSVETSDTPGADRTMFLSILTVVMVGAVGAYEYITHSPKDPTSLTDDKATLAAYQTLDRKVHFDLPAELDKLRIERLNLEKIPLSRLAVSGGQLGWKTVNTEVNDRTKKLDERIGTLKEKESEFKPKTLGQLAQLASSTKGAERVEVVDTETGNEPKESASSSPVGGSPFGRLVPDGGMVIDFNAEP